MSKLNWKRVQDKNLIQRRRCDHVDCGIECDALYFDRNHRPHKKNDYSHLIEKKITGQRKATNERGYQNYNQFPKRRSKAPELRGVIVFRRINGIKTIQTQLPEKATPCKRKSSKPRIHRRHKIIKKR